MKKWSPPGWTRYATCIAVCAPCWLWVGPVAAQEAIRQVPPGQKKKEDQKKAVPRIEERKKQAIEQLHTPSKDEKQLSAGERNKFIAELQSMIEQDQALRGCQVSDCYYRTVNGQRQLVLVGRIANNSQRERILEYCLDLMKRNPTAWPGVPNLSEVEVGQPPTEQLQTQLRDRIASDPTLEGIQLQRLDYRETDKGMRLVLVGRVASQEQKDLIVAACLDILKSDPTVWGDITPSAAGLVVVPPSVLASDTFFHEGIRLFRQCNYAAAATAFSQAVLEAPQAVDRHYWRIAAEIGAGEMDRAYRRLRPWVHMRRANPSAVNYVQILHAIEPVQGPIRWHLERLELRALQDIP